MSAPNGLNAKIMGIQAKGGKLYVKTNINMGSQEMEQVQGCDGVDCYEMNTMMGARMLEGGEKSLLLSQHNLDGMADWRNTYTSAELLGEEDVNGEPCYKIKLVMDGDQHLVQYVSKKDYLVKRIDITVTSVMGEMAMSTYQTEYADFSGYTLPTKVTMEVMQQQMTTTFTNYEFNSKVDDAKFQIPEQLKVAQ